MPDPNKIWFDEPNFQAMLLSRNYWHAKYAARLKKDKPTMKDKLKGYWTRFKSAVTGLFVKKSYAEAHKESTYGVRVKRKLQKKVAAKATKVSKKAKR